MGAPVRWSPHAIVRTARRDPRGGTGRATHPLHSRARRARRARRHRRAQTRPLGYRHSDAPLSQRSSLGSRSTPEGERGLRTRTRLCRAVDQHTRSGHRDRNDHECSGAAVPSIQTTQCSAVTRSAACWQRSAATAKGAVSDRSIWTDLSLRHARKTAQSLDCRSPRITAVSSLDHATTAVCPRRISDWLTRRYTPPFPEWVRASPAPDTIPSAIRPSTSSPTRGPADRHREHRHQPHARRADYHGPSSGIQSARYPQPTGDRSADAGPTRTRTAPDTARSAVTT